MSASETAAVDPVVPQEQLEENEGAKVFIGNLAYATTEDDVKGFLAPAGGELVSVELPKRGPRPAGFAFAYFKTDEEAKAAVEKLNGQELAERKLTLDIAKPASQKRDELKAKRKAANEKRKAAKAAERAEAGGVDATAAPVASDVAANGEDAEKPKKKKAPKKKTPRRRQAGEEDGEEAAEGAEAAPVAEGEAAAPARRTRTRKPRTESARIDDETEGGAEGGAEAKAPRAPKKRLLPTGEASKTSVFVANLPFSIDDEGLAALFDELSIKVKSAHVVYARKFPKSTTRRSKGFGFVEVEDPEQQHEAVEKLDGKMIGERALTVKIANELKEVEQAAEAAEGATEATA